MTRSRFLVALFAFSLVALPACDTDDLFFRNEVFTVVFSFDGSDLVERDDYAAYYQRAVNGLSEAYTEDGAVLLYADGALIDEADAGVTWTALPLTVGVDEDDDGQVDYTVTVSYSFEPGFVYVDLLGSAPLDFPNVERIDIRAVFIPGGVAFQAGVDHSSLEAVVEAYGLDAE